MDFLCKMSVSNIYFKLSFLVTINKFSTTSSASLPLPKICRWRWHPKCPQIWVTASQPLFFPLHTHWVPPRPTSRLPLVEGSRMMAVAGRAAAAKGFITLHWEFHCCSTEKKEDKGLQLDHWVSLGLLGMEGEPEGGGGDTEEEGGAVSPSSQVGLNLWLSHEGRGEKLSLQKNVWEKKIQVGGGGGMKGEGVEVGGWGVFTYYMCDITHSLSFSTKSQRTSAGQSPSPQNQEKKTARCIFY